MKMLVSFVFAAAAFITVRAAFSRAVVLQPLSRKLKDAQNLL